MGLVCVGASIAALNIAAFLMSRSAHTAQHDAAGASSNNHITTNGNCVTNESIVGPKRRYSELVIVSYAKPMLYF